MHANFTVGKSDHFFDHFNWNIVNTARRPHIVCVLLWLGILTLSLQAHATLGVVVMTEGGTVIGIDSNITGGRHPGLACKVRHNGKVAIIASGTYDFLDDSGQYDFWQQATQVLAQSASTEDTGAALDTRIEPLLRAGLNALFISRRYYYRLHYRIRSVAEFIVVGMDEKGRPSAYHYQYTARTPTEFTCLKYAVHPAAGAGYRVEPIPLVNSYGTLQPKPGSTSPQIADQIVKFIDAAREKFPVAGIGDPVTTLLVDKNGVKLLNGGACISK